MKAKPEPKKRKQASKPLANKAETLVVTETPTQQIDAPIPPAVWRMIQLDAPGSAQRIDAPLPPNSI